LHGRTEIETTAVEEADVNELMDAKAGTRERARKGRKSADENRVHD
jgi:hypothetical protein